MVKKQIVLVIVVFLILSMGLFAKIVVVGMDQNLYYYENGEWKVEVTHSSVPPEKMSLKEFDTMKKRNKYYRQYNKIRKISVHSDGTQIAVNSKSEIKFREKELDYWDRFRTKGSSYWRTEKASSLESSSKGNVWKREGRYLYNLKYNPKYKSEFWHTHYNFIDYSVGNDGTCLAISKDKKLYWYINGKWEFITDGIQNVEVGSSNEIYCIKDGTTLLKLNGKELEKVTHVGQGIKDLKANEGGVIVMLTKNNELHLKKDGRWEKIKIPPQLTILNVARYIYDKGEKRTWSISQSQSKEFKEKYDLLEAELAKVTDERNELYEKRSELSIEYKPIKTKIENIRKSLSYTYKYRNRAKSKMESYKRYMDKYPKSRYYKRYEFWYKINKSNYERYQARVDEADKKIDDLRKSTDAFEKLQVIYENIKEVEIVYEKAEKEYAEYVAKNAAILSKLLTEIEISVENKKIRKLALDATIESLNSKIEVVKGKEDIVKNTLATLKFTKNTLNKNVISYSNKIEKLNVVEDNVEEKVEGEEKVEIDKKEEAKALEVVKKLEVERKKEIKELKDNLAKSEKQLKEIDRNYSNEAKMIDKLVEIETNILSEKIIYDSELEEILSTMEKEVEKYNFIAKKFGKKELELASSSGPKKRAGGKKKRSASEKGKSSDGTKEGSAEELEAIALLMSEEMTDIDSVNNPYGEEISEEDQEETDTSAEPKKRGSSKKKKRGSSSKKKRGSKKKRSTAKKGSKSQEKDSGKSDLTDDELFDLMF